MSVLSLLIIRDFFSLSRIIRVQSMRNLVILVSIFIVETAVKLMPGLSHYAP